MQQKVEVSMKDFLRNARAAFEAHTLQMFNPASTTPSCVGPCVIGVSLTPEQRELADMLGIEVTITEGDEKDIIRLVQWHDWTVGAFHSPMLSHAGYVESFENELKYIEEKYL